MRTGKVVRVRGALGEEAIEMAQRYRQVLMATSRWSSIASFVYSKVESGC